MAEKKNNHNNGTGNSRPLPLGESRNKNSQVKPATTLPRNFVSPPPSARPKGKD